MAKSVKSKVSKDGESTTTGTHEAIQGFHDYAGEDHEYYEAGSDVSHLPAKKLKTFIEAGLVKKTVKAEEKEDDK